MATPAAHPRASLLGLPPSLLAHVVQLGAPSSHEQEFEADDWHGHLGTAKPLRHRRLVLDDTDVVQLAAGRDDGKLSDKAAEVARPYHLDQAKFVHVPSLDNPAALRQVYPSLKALESLRLYLDKENDYELSDLADLPNLRRLTITDCTISATAGARLPTRLVELELLGIKADKTVMDRLIQSNLYLETVHLTPLEAGPGDFYCPGAALAALEQLRLFQYTPPRLPRGEDAPRPAYDTLIAPFIQRLAPSLLFVHDTFLASPSALKRDLRRILVHFDEYDEDKLEMTPGALDKVADWVTSAPNLAVVALPVDSHPDYTSMRSGDVLGLQLGVNSIVNACEARGVRIVYYDEDRDPGPGVVALSDEVRSGRCRGADIDDSRDPGDTCPEWPGSWDALRRMTRLGALMTESDEEREVRRSRPWGGWGGGGYVDSDDEDSDESGSDWSI